MSTANDDDERIDGTPIKLLQIVFSEIFDFIPSHGLKALVTLTHHYSRIFIQRVEDYHARALKEMKKEDDPDVDCSTTWLPSWKELDEWGDVTFTTE